METVVPYFREWKISNTKENSSFVVVTVIIMVSVLLLKFESTANKWQRICIDLKKKLFKNVSFYHLVLLEWEMVNKDAQDKHKLELANDRL